VEYVEFTIPTDFPFHLRQYIPNVHFSPHTVILDDEGIRQEKLLSIISHILAGIIVQKYTVV